MSQASPLLTLMTAVLAGSLALATPIAAPAKTTVPPVQAQTPTLAPVLKKVMPAVVNIKTIRAVNPAMPGMGPMTSPDKAISLGSGVIVDAKNGYVLTNQHVIEEAQEIVITLSDGRRVFGEAVGGDELSDVAVLKINADDLQSIELGRSDNLAVGDYVIAIGNPFGLTQSATAGIISALGRDNLGLEGFEDFIQTDASINPGNSGGALVNLQGELIGINTAILSPEGGNIGIGFAIPIDMASNLMQQLLDYGEVKRGALGVIAQPLTPDLAQAFGLKGQEGAVIAQVVPNSIAAMAGLKVTDLIKAIDGKPILNATHLKNTIGLIPVGQSFTIDIMRDGKTKHIKTSMLDPRSLHSNESKINPRLAGATLGPVTRSVAGHGEVVGLEILNVNPGSAADKEGFRRGDIIVSANNQAVTELDTLKAAASKSKDYLLLRVVRKQTAFFLALKSK